MLFLRRCYSGLEQLDETGLSREALVMRFDLQSSGLEKLVLYFHPPYNRHGLHQNSWISRVSAIDLYPGWHPGCTHRMS